VRIVSVVGTRPQLIKAAALTPALRARHEDVFVDTGQHYDEVLAGVFFAELGLPRPDHVLGVGGGTQGRPPELRRSKPSSRSGQTPSSSAATESTLAGALAAAAGDPVAVEAGLRLRSAVAEMSVHRDHLALVLRADVGLS
jgi:UDP-N-acetylglucosamine 2-epimerase